MNDGLDSWLDEWLSAHSEELIADRRHLHAHPELSGEEVATTEFIGERLQVAGLQPRLLTAGTGLLCDIGVGHGPTVALRADIDGLAMDDEKDTPYRSRNPGVAHACGHDVHTTVVLGAGLALNRYLDHAGVDGKVRLIFQPAEETVPGGALGVIADGGLDGIELIFGVHCDPRLEVGKVGLRSGAITSAADMFELTLHGPGGHTARPERTVDLVAVAAQLVCRLPRMVNDLAAGAGELSVVFGALRTGDAANVIPATAVLRGSVRTPDRKAWDQAPRLLESAVLDVLEGSEAEFELDYTRGVPAVVNDPAATALMSDAIAVALGDKAIATTAQSNGGDDFAWYLERTAGSYARLGVRNVDHQRALLDLHASNFDVDEGAIAVGVRTLVTTALRAIDERSSDRR
ncbi:MAG: putative hydrolase YxeP [Acidimicrobiales bacterium]|nr:MAG: amidohydrolase [Actinomycetota bacterium]MBV6507646.1 putative hydrolase YxeP [Acidimicrobiales bacterium]RIK07577.1 MAG: amidohydrolase [Acidobacteriota bacterium]